MMRLVDAVYPNVETRGDNIGMDEFLDSLNDIPLMMRIRDQNPSTMEEAYDKAVNFESYTPANQQWSGSDNAKPRFDNRTRAVTTEETAEASTVEDAEKRQLREELERLKLQCKANAVVVPTKTVKQCTYCSRRGHEAKDCWAPGGQNADNAPTRTKPKKDEQNAEPTQNVGNNGQAPNNVNFNQGQLQSNNYGYAQPPTNMSCGF